ncbi:MAG: prolyl oligopeptidase family serine peptidase, partial [Pseudomonadales bacterium]|nr:prolyl oligopeptidase family serine peptidase [Pseudomonadales bacterium]
EPDLYKCSIAGAGVYDNEVQYESSDFAEGTRWGKKYLDKVVGPSKEERAAASPATFAHKIKTPLLLVHGEDDVRVPVEQAYVMQNAMKAAGKPVPELIELPNEGHTPRKEENNLRWRRATIDFIEKHIGPGVKPRAVASQ